MSRSESQGVMARLLILVIYAVSLQTGFGSFTTLNTKFIKLEHLEFECEVSHDSLIPGLENSLACARACSKREDCTSYVFTPSTSSAATGPRLGTCTMCPAHNITGLNFSSTNSQSETWFNILGRVFEPQPLTYIPISGALSIGRLMIVKGRTPEPEPERSVVDVLDKINGDIAIRISPRFNYRDTVKGLVVSNRLDGNWSVTILPESKFLFSEGQDFEISYLATRIGFRVYVNEIFMKWVGKSIHLAGDLHYLSFENTDLHMLLY